MKRIAQFEKVSKTQFSITLFDLMGVEPKHINEAHENKLNKVYEAIKLPKRATSGSAGYDFYSPDTYIIKPGCSVKIPTGIRVKIEEGWVLNCYPRSGLGFKYRMSLVNTVGIVDADYYYSDNEGHIMLKVYNPSDSSETITIKTGDRFAQGVFTEFGITYDDAATAYRSGGMGSTGK